MNYINDPKRKLLISQVLSATTMPEIEEAIHALQEWVREHPDDRGIVDGFEQLSLMQDIAEEGTATSESSGAPAVVKSA